MQDIPPELPDEVRHAGAPGAEPENTLSSAPEPYTLKRHFEFWLQNGRLWKVLAVNILILLFGLMLFVFSMLGSSL